MIFTAYLWLTFLYEQVMSVRPYIYQKRSSHEFYYTSQVSLTKYAT